MAKLIGCLLAVCLLFFSASTKSGKTPVGVELVPAGTPYSLGILAGDTLYVSGLQGTDPKTHALPDDFGQEARNCLENIGHVLNDAHMNYSDVVSVQIYLVDIVAVPGSERHLQGVLQESPTFSNDCAGRQVVLGCSHRDLGYRAQMTLIAEHVADSVSLGEK